MEHRDYDVSSSTDQLLRLLPQIRFERHKLLASYDVGLWEELVNVSLIHPVRKVQGSLSWPRHPLCLVSTQETKFCDTVVFVVLVIRLIIHLDSVVELVIVSRVNSDHAIRYGFRTINKRAFVCNILDSSFN